MNDDTQKQTESLIRLLLAARYQDAKITMAESNELEKRLEHLPWNSGTGLSVFIMQQTATVRKALASEAAKEKFLTEECKHFTTPVSRAFALKTIEAVLQADGIDTKESKFLGRIEKHTQK